MQTCAFLWISRRGGNVHVSGHATLLIYMLGNGTATTNGVGAGMTVCIWLHPWSWDALAHPIGYWARLPGQSWGLNSAYQFGCTAWCMHAFTHAQRARGPSASWENMHVPLTCLFPFLQQQQQQTMHERRMRFFLFRYRSTFVCLAQYFPIID